MFTSLHQNRLNAKKNAVYRESSHDEDQVAEFEEVKTVMKLMETDYWQFKALFGYKCRVENEEPGYISLRFTAYTVNENDAYKHFYARVDVYIVDKEAQEDLKKRLEQFTAI